MLVKSIESPYILLDVIISNGITGIAIDVLKSTVLPLFNNIFDASSVNE